MSVRDRAPTPRLIRSLLIGLVAGSRALTPLAVVGEAARRGALGRSNGAAALLGHPLVAAGAKALAAAELGGDKMHAAPDRIVPAGLAARLLTGGLAGAALAPRGSALAGAVLGAAGAIGAAYLTFDLRRRAMARFGQTSTGLVEDALTVGAAQWVTGGRGRRPRRRERRAEARRLARPAEGRA
jgi:uncharacterized membrane protein